ncbi:MBL fold metallo-hydrolase [Mobilitalea sibirica]|uniref:MBL fold metallo-hydrolase n=1 Tax=Mobilitalea sibirica TaxID=1462919 RepID=A0A8J7HBJ6_9FIRM|nr:MBL fold metallo-hydrolase [Mobilitalea sibirica]MBH1941171.1 MBL fold metallo-hydrolase [Mobilitalea sibirica]
MHLTFLGATHEVTGSCFYLEACNKHILIDCGMEQGRDAFENQDIPIPAAQIDAVVLTHAHMDHSGKLPMIYSQGFRGKIHATSATSALCDIMLRDSAHIQMAEAEWRNRKGKRSGDKAFIPLYDMEDALSTIRMFVPHEYGEKFTLFDGIEIRFTDVGHLLGSSSIEIWVTEEGITKKLVFSGDIGNVNQPLIKDPQYIKEADYVIMESTYGDRNHGETPDYVGELSRVIQETFDRGGNVVIPSFAIGRTQVLLYFIRKIKEDRLVKGHGDFKVYVDSPLAIEATQIYEKNMFGYFDRESMDLIHRGINPIKFPGLKTSITSDESKAINFDEEPKVIISAAGMCDAGRIRHHLKHNLWREDSTILFVGHQSVGTLGRILLDGATEVKLFGEQITVCASIKRLSGVSGHADRDGLLKWLQSFEKKPSSVFVVHGDDQVCNIFTEYIRDELGYNAVAPYSGTIYDLRRNVCVVEGKMIPVEKKTETVKVDSVFERLLNAGKRLLVVIQKNKGGANKDLAKFASQINSLCDKWDR